MAWFRKIKAGLVKFPTSEYIGEEGNLFFNTETGTIYLSDGVTPGGSAITDRTQPTSWMIVENVNELPNAVGDEHILPENTLVMLAGTVDIGANALRLSTGTVLRGFANEVLVSSNPNGVVRATNVGSNVVLREFSIVATAGPCLDLTGAIDYQLNMNFVGFLGASAGTVTGFDVQGFKSCFFNTAVGLRLAGTTNKVYIEGCPFYGVAPGGAALTFDATLNAAVADLPTNYFKFDNATGIRADAGYQVGSGILRGTLIVGAGDTPLEGLDPSDLNWDMNMNTGVRDSRVAATSTLATPTTLTITTQGTYVPLTGTFNLAGLTERFVLSGSQVQYVGQRPALINASNALSIDAANNDLVWVRLTKNGVGIEETRAAVEQGSGPNNLARPVSLSGLVSVVDGDVIGVEVSNQTSTDNITITVANINVIGR